MADHKMISFDKEPMSSHASPSIAKKQNFCVARKPEEIELFRGFWEKTQRHPNSDMDYYLDFVATSQSVIRPHVIALYSDDCPQAILVGRIEEISLQIRFGYKTVCSPRIRSLSIGYGGLLGEFSQSHSTAFLKEILETLHRGEADVVLMNHLRVDSDLFRLARQLPGFFLREHFPSVSTHWRMSLPSSIDEFLSKISSKHRYWLRRLERVLEKDYPGGLTFKRFTSAAEVVDLCANAEAVASNTYQRGMGVGFIHTKETEQLLTASAKRNWLRGYVLYVNEEPRAFWVGTLYKDTFYLDYTGFDDTLRRYEPGTILFLKMIEDLCKAGARQVDFGFGTAFYKERWGDEHWAEASVHIFAPGIRNALINSLRGMASASSLTMEKILKRWNLLNRLKRAWRNNLSGHTQG